MFGARPFAPHRMEIAVERMKRGMRQPRFVKVQVVHITIQQPLDGFGVVKHPVIGRLRQRHDARLDGIRVDARQQRISADLGLDRLDLEGALLDRADNAPMVARGFQKDRHSARHDDAVQDGFVAVAIHHNHITGGHRMVPDHLVRGRGAVRHEKAMIGIEDTRRIALGRTDGTVVIQ